MKKPILSFLAALCLYSSAFAQVKHPYKKITNAIEFAPVAKPGVEVPSITIPVEGLTGGKLNIAETGDQLLIIDFWATWCAPCRALIPHLDSLQRRFGDKVMILPVTYESRSVAFPVLSALQKTHPFDLPEVYNDKVLIQLFPHKALPHEVWIRGGKVVAITEGEELTPVNIKRVLSGAAGLVVKRDSVIAFDRKRPFLMGGNGGDGSGLVFHEVLSRYVPGFNGGTNVTGADSVHGQRFSGYNTTLLSLWKLAYHDSLFFIPKARVRMFSRDSSLMTSRLSGQAYLDWLAAGHGWNYELVVPPGMTGERGYARMRQGLSALFPKYRVRLEEHTVKCLVLVRTSGVDKLASSGGTYQADISPFACHIHAGHLVELFWRLEGQFMQRSPVPVVDGTGYKGLVDLDFEGSLSDVAAMNAGLARYDLAFVEKDYPVKLLVIRDNDQY